MTGLLGTV